MPRSSVVCVSAEMRLWSEFVKRLFSLQGYLLGGHVMRLCHGHDESLTIPGAEKNEEEQRSVDN